MADAILRAIFEAKVEGINKDLNKLQKELRKTEKQAEEVGLALGGGGKGGKGGIDQKTLDMKRALRTTTPTLLEFNRVIQDAPFGMQGVANNLQQLTGNFSTFSTKVGGARVALGALAKAMFTGPQGILLLVSAVTAAWVAFGSKIGNATDKIKDLDEAFEKLNKTFQLELSLNEQIEKNLTLQELSTTGILDKRGKILNSQLLSTQQIILQNRALFLQNKLAQQTISDWELISKAVKTLAASAVILIKGFYSLNKAAFDAIREPLEKMLGLEIIRSKVTGQTKKEVEQEKKLRDQMLVQENALAKIQGKILELNKGITKEKEKQLDSSGGGGPGLAPLNFDSNIPGGTFDILPSAIDKLTQKTTNAMLRLNAKYRNGWKALEITTDTFAFSLAARFEALNETLKPLIEGQLISTFTDLGSNIGEALANGGDPIKAFGASILNSFGQFLKEFGKKAVMAGTIALLANTAFASLFTPAGPGAAIALIGYGTALAAAGGALSAFGERGLAGQGAGGSGLNKYNTGSDSFSGSTSTGGVQTFGDGTVVFEIAGTKLVGVLSRTLAQNKRLGGTLNLGG